MSTSTGHPSQGSSSLETATETGHDIHVHARCNMLVTWSDSGMHLVSIDYDCTNASHVGQMSWDLVATPNPLLTTSSQGVGDAAPPPHPTPWMRAGFGFHNEVKDLYFSVPSKDSHYWVHLQSMCRNLFAQEWTYPQPGSSHTFCCFCCCFCGGNSAQHHGKSCWCHLTSCLPPLCYILSDPSIHLPLTSSPSLCPSSLRSQY